MDECNERQRRWLRGEGRQTGNTTTNDRVGGDGVVAINDSKDKAQRRRLRCRGSQACEMGEGGRPEVTINKWRGSTMPRNNQQTEGCNERQRHWLRGGGRQTGDMTTNNQVRDDGAVAIKRRGAD